MLCKLTASLSGVSRFCIHYSIGLLRILFVLTNNVYCIPTYTVWMISIYPIKVFINSDLYWFIEGKLFHWLLSMVSLWSYSAGYDIVESGDRIDSLVDKECLVLVNHQSTSDVPLLMAAFNARKNLLPNLTWVMDRAFKYTNFGIVSSVHGDFFIDAGRDKRDQSIKNLIQYLQGTFIPCKRRWLVLFPEGGFLRKRKAASQRYAEKMNFPAFDHVTVPRMGAVQAILETIGPSPCPTANGEAKLHKQNGISASSANNRNNNVEIVQPSTLKYIIDITVAYPGGKPLDLGAIITGLRKACPTHFHYKVYPIESIPIEASKFQDWLIKRFEEKEMLLKKYYETGLWDIHLPGAFVGDGVGGGACSSDDSRKYKIPTAVTQDLLRMGLIHIFFILSSYYHWTILSYLVHRVSNIML